MFDATNIVKSSDKEKWVYSGYGIAFDVADSWNFDNDFARNVIIFGVDNSSSSHTDNRKNTFSVLDGGPTYSINRSFGSPEKMLTVNFSNGYLFVNGKEIFKCKNDNKNVNFPTPFCLGSISNGFGTTESRQISLKGNANDFSVNYSAIDKSHILNICKYLMIKINIK